MSLFNKARPGQAPASAPQRHGAPGSGHSAGAVVVSNGPTLVSPAKAPATTSRLSNGLKEFLWQLEGIGRGQLLDLGPARQTTLNFFIERNFKVYTEDFLATWKNFLDEETAWLKSLPPGTDRGDRTPGTRAERFLETTLLYPPDTFDAVLMWDTLDYLDSELMARLAARITDMMRDGGVVLAIFHQKKPEQFHRYRVLDAQNLELIPASSPFQPQRVLQNREISNLFGRYRSSKMFVGRDQLREGMFVK
jgi:hypothetical protein